jgi:glycosyltransferase involved in cell wall biosynthesis
VSERAGHPPLVSVVVPGRDAVGFLGDTLVSLERQLDDPSQLEVIFVDDASGDGTAEVIAAHGELAMPVRVLQTGRPVGVSAARNLGLQVAEGQFLGFLDADDWFAPRHLQRLADALAHLECDFVRTDLVLVNGRARTVVRAPESRRGVVLPSLSGILPVSSRSMVDHPSMFAGLFHRRLVDRGLLCFDETLSSAEDREQMWRLHLATDTFAVVDAPGAFYRRGLASSLTQVRDERRLGYLDAFESVRCIVAQHPHGEELSEKAAQTVLALTAQHLARESDRGMLRRQLVGGALALLRRFPEATVRACVRRLDGERRQLLAPVLSAGGWVR